LKFKLEGKTKTRKEEGRKKKGKIKRHTQKTFLGETKETLSSPSGCNNIQGTESFKNDFLIHVICVCVEKR
jgi:heat shock protein HslJ